MGNALNQLYDELIAILREYVPLNHFGNPDSRIVTAYHEAGHAVFAINYRLGLSKVLIKENEKEGETHVRFYDFAEKYPYYAKYIFAGIISQYLNTGNLEDKNFFGDFHRVLLQRLPKIYFYLLDYDRIYSIFRDTILEVYTVNCNKQTILIAMELMKKDCLKRNMVMKILGNS